MAWAPPTLKTRSTPQARAARVADSLSWYEGYSRTELERLAQEKKIATGRGLSDRELRRSLMEHLWQADRAAARRTPRTPAPRRPRRAPRA